MNRQAAFLMYLHQALGTPYVWGGESRAGFDCSGLVAWAAQKAGIRGVPRTSEEQYKVGVPVSMNRLLPGDLVFAYPEPGGPGHVVVYIGHGKVIAAPHTGTNVQVENLSDFKGLIVGARRVLANPQGHVYQAGQFAGGGGNMPGDAQNQGVGQDRQKLAALALLQQSMKPVQVNPLQMPTAQGTIQNILNAHTQASVAQNPTNLQVPGIQPQLAGATAIQQPSQMPNYAGQLASIHSQLVKQTA